MHCLALPLPSGDIPFRQPWIEKKRVHRRKAGGDPLLLRSGGRISDRRKREIRKKEEVEEEAQEVIRELIKGPKGRLPSHAAFPDRIMSFQLDIRGQQELISVVPFRRITPGQFRRDDDGLFRRQHAHHQLPGHQEGSIPGGGKRDREYYRSPLPHRPIASKPDLIRK